MVRRLTIPVLLLVAAALVAAGPALRSDAQEVSSPPVVEEVPLADVSVLEGAGWQQEVAADANLVAVEWGGDPDATFTIDVHAGDGRWEPAGSLGRQEHGPDPGTAEGDAAAQPTTYKSDPLWTDAVSAVRVTLAEGAATGISLVAIDSPPVNVPVTGQPAQAGVLAGGLAVAGLAGAVVALVSGRRRLLALGVLAAIVAVALSGCAPVKGAPVPDSIISHATWGGDLPWNTGGAECGTSGPTINPGGIGFAVVHHTAGENAYSPQQSWQIIRGIWAHHAANQGWCDIGYNFLVDRYGTIFEGRWGGWDKAVVGAHAIGFNTGGTGIAFIGHHSSAPVTAQSHASLINLIAWKFQVHNVDPTQWNTIIGHRDVNQTECPGNAAYGLLPGVRDAVRQRV